MKRGVLKAKAMPVARTRVGNSSGSHTGIQEYCPSVKKPFTQAASSSRLRSCVHRNSTGVMTSAAAKNSITIGLRPNTSAKNPRLI